VKCTHRALSSTGMSQPPNSSTSVVADDPFNIFPSTILTEGRSNKNIHQFFPQLIFSFLVTVVHVLYPYVCIDSTIENYNCIIS
jgi:hypothetical protein